MYINEFLAGVLATVGVELALIVAIAGYFAFKKK